MADQPSSSEAAEPQKRKRGRPKGRLNDVTLKLIELGVLPAPGAPRGPPKPRGRPRKTPQHVDAAGGDLGPMPASGAASVPGHSAAAPGLAAGHTADAVGDASQVASPEREESAATSSETTISQEVALPQNGPTTGQTAEPRVPVQPSSGQEHFPQQQQQQQPRPQKLQLFSSQSCEPPRRKRGRPPKKLPAGAEMALAPEQAGALAEQKQEQHEHEQPDADSAAPAKKKRGRPAKPKHNADTPHFAAGADVVGPVPPAKRGRGRPKGSTNKTTGVQLLAAAAAAGPASPAKRGRGRPKGSKNKPKGWQLLTAAVQQQLQQDAAGCTDQTRLEQQQGQLPGRLAEDVLLKVGDSHADATPAADLLPPDQEISALAEAPEPASMTGGRQARAPLAPSSGGPLPTKVPLGTSHAMPWEPEPQTAEAGGTAGATGLRAQEVAAAIAVVLCAPEAMTQQLPVE